MKRRDFIKLLGGTAAAWPLIARAQQMTRMRRIGALMDFSEYDPQSTIGTSAFEHGLEERGWKLGTNLQIKYRWANYPNLLLKFAHELVALAPDVILAVGGSSASALQEVTRTIPVVFMEISDPVNRRLITSMERPGGNFTGLIEFQPGIGRKWLELLKQIAPAVTRVAVIQDPSRFAWRNLLTSIEKAASTSSVKVSPVDARDGVKMERMITTFASSPNGGLMVTPNTFSVLMRDRIIALAARHKLPAIYFNQLFVTDGGLASYAPDTSDQYRRAAGYIDRILKGEKPADMSIQAPTKFEFVINLKAAQTIGLNIPAGVLAVADRVIK
ncbi:MAG: ABC transporter substrate-binding protein [Pseudolabrys sp.]|jgi:putative ABC transport system substrate-binding protein